MFGSVNVLDVHPVHGPDQRMGRKTAGPAPPPLCTKSIDLGLERRQLFFLRCRNWRTDSDAHVQLRTSGNDAVRLYSNDFRSMRHNTKGHRQTHRSRSRKADRKRSLRPADSFRRIPFPCRSNRPESLKKDLPPGVGQKRPSALLAFLSARTWCCRRVPWTNEIRCPSAGPQNQLLPFPKRRTRCILVAGQDICNRPDSRRS